MYILNTDSAIKKIAITELKDFAFGNYYRRIRFCKKKQFLFNETSGKKDIQLFATKLTAKIHHLSNAKESNGPLYSESKT